MGGPVELPDKLFFKIGEVARIVGAEPYVLRYWESEFSSFVKPRKSKGGQRLYRRTDVEALLHIKDLLRRQQYTIAGARQHLAEEKAKRPQDPKAQNDPLLDERARQLVQEIQTLKEKNASLDQRLKQTAQHKTHRDNTLRQIRKDVSKILKNLRS